MESEKIPVLSSQPECKMPRLPEKTRTYRCKVRQYPEILSGMFEYIFQNEAMKNVELKFEVYEDNVWKWFLLFDVESRGRIKFKLIMDPCGHPAFHGETLWLPTHWNSWSNKKLPPVLVGNFWDIYNNPGQDTFPGFILERDGSAEELAGIANSVENMMYAKEVVKHAELDDPIFPWMRQLHAIPRSSTEEKPCCRRECCGQDAKAEWVVVKDANGKFMYTCELPNNLLKQLEGTGQKEELESKKGYKERITFLEDVKPFEADWSELVAAENQVELKGCGNQPDVTGGHSGRLVEFGNALAQANSEQENSDSDEADDEIQSISTDTEDVTSISDVSDDTEDISSISEISDCKDDTDDVSSISEISDIIDDTDEISSISDSDSKDDTDDDSSISDVSDLEDEFPLPARYGYDLSYLINEIPPPAVICPPQDAYDLLGPSQHVEYFPQLAKDWPMDSIHNNSSYTSQMLLPSIPSYPSQNSITEKSEYKVKVDTDHSQVRSEEPEQQPSTSAQITNNTQSKSENYLRLMELVFKDTKKETSSTNELKAESTSEHLKNLENWESAIQDEIQRSEKLRSEVKERANYYEEVLLNESDREKLKDATLKSAVDEQKCVQRDYKEIENTFKESIDAIKLSFFENYAKIVELKEEIRAVASSIQ